MRLSGQFAASLTLAILASPTLRAAPPAPAPNPAAASAQAAAAGSAASVRHGVIDFTPDAHESTAVPELFRLPAKQFPFEIAPQPTTLKGVSVAYLTFPSPVHTACEPNNTVHCEYYRPTAPGRYPACIVLHILGGDFPLSRAFAASLAQRGVAALFVIMPYYGPRQNPNSPVRMISSNARQTVDGMIQAVKDIRVATTWLAEQPEVDPRQLGIFGISLGGITAALAAEAEPRFAKVCPVLAGGCVGAVLWESKEKHVVAARKIWESTGGSHDALQALIEKVDPATYAGRLRGRRILMLNALHDEIIPRKCTEILWKDLGQPKIVWYDCGHVSAIWHILDALQQVTDFFQPDKAK